MSEFSGYSAIVTGGSMGIGAATARALCGAGARVTVLDVQDGSALAAALPGCRFAAVDVRDPEAVTRAIDAAADAQDGLDGLVNNAGIGPARLLDATHAEGWDELIDINLKGAFNCTKAAVPHLRARGGGASSTSPRSPARTSLSGRTSPIPSRSGEWSGSPGTSPTSSPRGASGPTRSSPARPGPGSSAGGMPDPAARRRRSRAGVPLGRLIEPEEIANAITFFLSPRAAMCTGAELVVDGGILLGSANAYEDYFRNRGGEPPPRPGG